jgi:Peptidase family C25
MPFVRDVAGICIAAIIAFASPSVARACSGSVHIEVQQPGVYALDYASIIAQQPALTDCRSDDLTLTQRGHEVPLRVSGDHAGRFGVDARIEWIGEPLHGPSSWLDPYSPVNVYILSASASHHARMDVPAVNAGTGAAALVRRLHLERDNELIRLDQSQMKPGDEPDVWQWAKLTHADPKPFALAFDLPDLAARERSGVALKATLDFRGVSFVPKHADDAKPDDHVVDVTLNGKSMGSLRWDGRDEMRREIALPVALLRPRNNVLSLHVPARFSSWDAENPVVDVVMFNWMDLTYPIEGNIDASRASFEVASASAPIELTRSGGDPVALYSSAGQYDAGVAVAKGRYRFSSVAPGVRIYPVAANDFLKPALVRAVAGVDWRNTDPGYDDLIISHPSLVDAIGPLAEFHRQHGRKVAVIDVDQVYDQFNAGIVHPAAIRDLISWGRTHWRIKPRYVLLVGTASFDIRASGQPISMQPASFDPRTGVPFAKRPDNPAATADAAPAAQPPNRNLIPTWQYPTEEGQSASDNGFVALSDSNFHPALAIGRFPVVTAEEVRAIVNKTVNYASTPTLGSWRSKVTFIANEDVYFQKSSDQIATAIEREGFTADKIYGKASETDNLANQAALNDSLNAGNLLVHFLGHGGRFIWRTGPPDVNKNHDLFTLDDVSKLHNGNRLPLVLSMTCFSAPFDNPSEDSIGERFLREPDKGAVAVFAASWSNSPSPEFSKKLIAELIKPGQTIGDSIVAAKAALSNRTLVEMYNLLGDPALVLERPQDRIRIARSADRWQEAIAVHLPEPGFGGEVTVNWLGDDGTPLQTQTYEARDSQFQLAIPSPLVVEVQIYAANLRTGRDAMGGLDFRPPPPPAMPRSTIPLIPPIKPNVAPPAKSVPVTAAPRAARTSSLPDEIVHHDFGGRTKEPTRRPRPQGAGNGRRPRTFPMHYARQ